MTQNRELFATNPLFETLYGYDSGNDTQAQSSTDRLIPAIQSQSASLSPDAPRFIPGSIGFPHALEPVFRRHGGVPPRFGFGIPCRDVVAPACGCDMNQEH